MWLATLYLLCGGQAPEPELPRVIRADGQVCVEALDENGAVRAECRPEGTPWSPSRAAVKPPPGPRGVASVNVGAGVLTGAALTLPELAFIVDAGILFPNGVGVVGLGHGHLSPMLSTPRVGLLQRYGLGAALRLGARSHFLVGVSGTLKLLQDTTLVASPSFSVVLKGALVVHEAFTFLLLPVFSFDTGVTFSVSAGVGATF
ncbi:MAG: hypothetical protein Q8L48_08355 [Archangium sp.]|nr:hypothetical protein [Archangium sp.]